ncbi:MAG: sodium:alanine symporter family protein [Acidobacteriota bacterium]
MERLVEWHATLNSWVWGPYTMAALMGAGLYFTFLTGGIQIRRLIPALREVIGKALSRSSAEGSVTPFQAVATALASTVGVGNIAGVATAITLGGPGALFWLLVSGLLGMATKFSEIVAALSFRHRDPTGTWRGGAMYILRDGLGLPRFGAVFALMAAMTGFGMGNMVQANSLAESLRTSFGVDSRLTGVLLVLLTGAVILGGIRRIAEVTQFLVPFMCLAYLLGSAVIIVRYFERIPEVVGLVLDSAFSGHAAVGGFAGAAVMQAVRYGIARGLFSNEAGLGSAPMVHAAARTDHPVRQAYYGIFEVFVDTILVCSATGLVVLLTGTWTGGETGAALTARAFETGLPGVWGDIVVTIGILTFAYSTILGWSFYGETAATYLLGSRIILPYRLAWLLFIYLGATGSLHLVWDIADTLNGLMAIPNLIAVIGVSRVIRRKLREFP